MCVIAFTGLTSIWVATITNKAGKHVIHTDDILTTSGTRRSIMEDVFMKFRGVARLACNVWNQISAE